MKISLNKLLLKEKELISVSHFTKIVLIIHQRTFASNCFHHSFAAISFSRFPIVLICIVFKYTEKIFFPDVQPSWVHWPKSKFHFRIVIPRLNPVHLKPRWPPVREWAWSLRFYGKIEDCEQSSGPPAVKHTPPPSLAPPWVGEPDKTWKLVLVGWIPWANRNMKYILKNNKCKH